MQFGVVVIAILAAFVLSAAGRSAGLPAGVSAHTFLSEGGVCPNFAVQERHYCLVVTTYDGLVRSGGIEVDLTVENFDQSTLSNPATDLTWLKAPDPNLSFASFSASPAGSAT